MNTGATPSTSSPPSTSAAGTIADNILDQAMAELVITLTPSANSSPASSAGIGTIS